MDHNPGEFYKNLINKYKTTLADDTTRIFPVLIIGGKPMEYNQSKLLYIITTIKENKNMSNRSLRELLSISEVNMKIIKNNLDTAMKIYNRRKELLDEMMLFIENIPMDFTTLGKKYSIGEDYPIGLVLFHSLLHDRDSDYNKKAENPKCYIEVVKYWDSVAHIESKTLASIERDFGLDKTTITRRYKKITGQDKNKIVDNVPLKDRISEPNEKGKGLSDGQKLAIDKYYYENKNSKDFVKNAKKVSEAIAENTVKKYCQIKGYIPWENPVKNKKRELEIIKMYQTKGIENKTIVDKFPELKTNYNLIILMHKNGIKLKNGYSSVTVENEETIKNLEAEQKFNRTEIAKLSGMDNRIVKRVLGKLDNNISFKKHEYDEQVFDDLVLLSSESNITSKIQEKISNIIYFIKLLFIFRILGKFASDGCTQGDRISWGQETSRKDFLDQIQITMNSAKSYTICKPRVNSINRQGIITYHNSKEYLKLNYHSKTLVKQMNKLGFMEKKTYFLKWPTWIPDISEIVAEFILGYLEGDGCISIYYSQEKIHTTLCICGTDKFLDGIIQSTYKYLPESGEWCVREDKRLSMENYRMIFMSTFMHRKVMPFLNWIYSSKTRPECYMKHKLDKCCEARIINEYQKGNKLDYVIEEYNKIFDKYKNIYMSKKEIYRDKEKEYREKEKAYMEKKNKNVRKKIKEEEIINEYILDETIEEIKAKKESNFLFDDNVQEIDKSNLVYMEKLRIKEIQTNSFTGEKLLNLQQVKNTKAIDKFQLCIKRNESNIEKAIEDFLKLTKNDYDKLNYVTNKYAIAYVKNIQVRLKEIEELITIVKNEINELSSKISTK